MPIVEAHVLEGYSSSEKSRLSAALTEAIRFVVPAPDEAITVLLHEYTADNYARGGTRRTPAPAQPDPAEIVSAFLGAMQDRDLETAKTYLGEGFQMVFPGTEPMREIEELLSWAKDRYRFVTKSTEAIEAFHKDGVAVVYTRGTLSGEWPDGTAFEGIRFIDRFEVRAGKIVDQQVWNDIAEVKAT